MKKCDACGVTEETHRIVKIRNEERYYCEKHRNQIKRYKKIKDYIQPELKDVLYCDICNANSIETRIYKNTKHRKTLCRKHNLQMNRHGRILEKTIYDKNDIIQHNSYIEIITRDSKGNIMGSTLIDSIDYEKVKDYKIYISKNYARISFKGGKKKNLHNYIMDCPDGKIVDHIKIDLINGVIGTLDNRRSNLRIVDFQKNAFNIHKDIKKGCSLCDKTNRYKSTIMYNYKSIWLGKYDTFEEAKVARNLAEIKLFKEYRDFTYDQEIYEMYLKLNDSQIDNIIKNLSKKDIIYNFNNIGKTLMDSNLNIS